MNYDKRIVEGCKVKFVKNYWPGHELQSMLGKIYTVTKIEKYPGHDGSVRGCLHLNGWMADFTQVEFVEENEFEQRKQANKEGKLWWRFPNDTGEYSKKWSLLSVDVPEQLIENRDFDEYGAEYFIGDNPPVEEIPKPVANDNIKIEFYNKDSGKVYYEPYCFYICSNGFVYEFDKAGDHRIARNIGFRITVEK